MASNKEYNQNYNYASYPTDLELLEYLLDEAFKKKYNITIGNLPKNSGFTSDYDLRTGKTTPFDATSDKKAYLINGQAPTRELLMELGRLHRNDIHNSEIALQRSINRSKENLAGLEGWQLSAGRFTKGSALALASLFPFLSPAAGKAVGTGLNIATKALTPSSYIPGTAGQLADTALLSYFATEAGKAAYNDIKSSDVPWYDKIGSASTAAIMSLPFLKPTVEAGKAAVEGVSGLSKWLSENIGLENGGIRFGNYVVNGPLSDRLYSGVPLPSISKSETASQASTSLANENTTLTSYIRNLSREMQNNIAVLDLPNGRLMLVDRRNGRSVYFRNNRLEYSDGSDISSYTPPQLTGRDAVRQLISEYKRPGRYINAKTGKPITITEADLGLTKEELANLTPSDLKEALRKKTHNLLDENYILMDHNIPVEEALKLIDSGTATYSDFLNEGATFNDVFYPADLDYDHVFSEYIMPAVLADDADVFGRFNIIKLSHSNLIRPFLTSPLAPLKNKLESIYLSKRSTLLGELNKLEKEYNSILSEGEKLQWMANNGQKIEDLKRLVENIKIDELFLKNRASALREMYSEGRPVSGKYLDPIESILNSYSVASYPLAVSRILKAIGTGRSIPFFAPYNPRIPVKLNKIGKFTTVEPTELQIKILQQNLQSFDDLFNKTLLRDDAGIDEISPRALNKPGSINFNINGRDMSIPYLSLEEMSSNLNKRLLSLVGKYISDPTQRERYFNYFRVEPTMLPQTYNPSFETPEIIIPGANRERLLLFNRKDGGRLIKKNKF